MTHPTTWVADRFGVRLEGDPALHDLLGLALRRNPRRAHLLVSTVLGKHLPADPRTVHGTGAELGRLVGKVLDGRSALVLGFAETATGLGHCVAEALGADYLHSTRRSVPGIAAPGGFEEEHSHATSHHLLPEDPALLGRAEVLVLVDDELSTGRTARNTITELHMSAPRGHYVVATLVDLRRDDDRTAMARFAAELGVRVDVVSLAAGTVSWPAGFPAAVAALVDRTPGPLPAATEPRARVVRHVGAWPPGVREGGRHGFTTADVGAARN
ncbi:MAG: hypothetical protein QOC66_1555, partial [Pseudonocardiales bacterium]|nr:hypothetical protein [Pseudonocardiales bacterium]